MTSLILFTTVFVMAVVGGSDLPYNEMCLNCLCSISSLSGRGCGTQGCRLEGNTLYCGPFLMSFQFFQESGMMANLRAGGETKCEEALFMDYVTSMSRSKGTVKAYVDAHIERCGVTQQTITCQDVNRLFFMGRENCANGENAVTQTQWQRMRQCLIPSP